MLSAGDEKQEVPGGRGEATYVAKCPACKAQGSADVVSVSSAAIGGEEEGSASSARVVALECRGLEPVAWQAGEGFKVSSAAAGSAAEWECSFLQEAEFSEYDEKSECSVEVSGVKGEWVKG